MNGENGWKRHLVRFSARRRYILAAPRAQDRAQRIGSGVQEIDRADMGEVRVYDPASGYPAVYGRCSVIPRADGAPVATCITDLRGL